MRIHAPAEPDTNAPTYRADDKVQATALFALAAGCAARARARVAGHKADTALVLFGLRRCRAHPVVCPRIADQLANLGVVVEDFAKAVRLPHGYMIHS